MAYRTALVTGATGGLGKALARTIAKDGIEVALAGRRPEALEALAGEIAAGGGRARIYPFDLADPVVTEDEVRRADDEMGGLDLVIANAGVGTLVSPRRMSWAIHAPTISVNVAGAAATLGALIPRMVERGRGHLVGISSLGKYRAGPRAAAYAASKAFLSIFLEGLHLDLRRSGVKVTDVRPGFVHTALTAQNRFKMPFLLEPERAAEIIWQGIVKERAVVAFPWPMALAGRIVRALPRCVFERLV